MQRRELYLKVIAYKVGRVNFYRVTKAKKPNIFVLGALIPTQETKRKDGGVN